MKSNPPLLAIVVPCYNEESVLEETTTRLLKMLDRLMASNQVDDLSYILYVNDGSRDRTWEFIEEAHQKDSRVQGLKLSINAGHQNALLAGLTIAQERSVSCALSLDADLQDDLEIIPEMLQQFSLGKEIVYAVRKEREKDTWFKKCSALLFYKTLSKLGITTIPNHADYRLIGAKALHSLMQFSEVNLFLRGLFPIMGFSTAKVYYDRQERFAGETKYPFRKMLTFAWEGITSFSIAPIRVVTLMGFITFAATLCIVAWIVWIILKGQSIPGWASTVLPIYFFGSIQLIAIGIVGEYIGKIYKEVKRRPRFLIEAELKYEKPLFKKSPSNF